MNSTKLIALALMGLSAATVTQAFPELTISDSSGDTVTLTMTPSNSNTGTETGSGYSNASAPDFSSALGTNQVSFDGSVGNWTINVDTGTSDITNSNPYMDLSFDTKYTGVAANTLTVTWTDSFSALLGGTAPATIGGTKSSKNTVTYTVDEGNTAITTPLTFANSPFSGNTEGTVTAGANTISQILTIAASGTNSKQTSGDADFGPVPDASMTWVLVGLGMASIGLLAYSRGRKAKQIL